MEIFKLFGSILINSDDADKSLAKTDEKVEGVGNKLSKGIGTAAKWGIGLATAAGTGAASLFGIAAKASETAASIDDISQRTNMSAQSLQEWKYAAEQSGFSLETIEGSAKKLTKTLGNYATGNKATVAAFKELGVSATDTHGKLRTTDDIFPEIIASLADMTDITKRDTLSMQIFGKSAMDMGPMLNSGSDGIEMLKIKANELGLVMSNDAISAGADFDDMLATVKSTLGALVTRIGVEVLPIAQRMLQWVTDHMPQIQSIATTAFDALSGAIKYVMDNANWLIPVLGGLLGTIVALNVISTVTKLMEAWKATTFATTLAEQGLNAALKANPIGLVVIAIGGLIAIFTLLWNNNKAFKDFVINMWGSIKQTFSNVVEGYIIPIINNVFIPLWNKVKTVFSQVFQQYIIPFIQTQLLPIFRNVFTTIGDVVKGAFNVIKWAWDNILSPLFKNILLPFIKNVLLPTWKIIFGGIGGAVSSAFNTVKSLWNGTLKPILNGILDFISGVFTANWSKAWNGMKTIFSGAFNGLKAIAKAPINAVISMINGFIRGINRVQIPSWVPGVGGRGINIPLIPSFAVGTRYLPQDMLIQAHKGEMIVPESENPYANSGGTVLGKKNDNKQDIYFQIDGKTFAKVTVPYNDREGGTNMQLVERGLIV